MTSLAAYRAADETARRQIRDRLDDNLFVVAGAGTGKTSALVDRFVGLVLAGRPVERLVAITFTEKAAAELADRVRGELERRQRDGKGDQGLLSTALTSLDRAEISTIHAFCLRTLRLFAAEAAIDPAFTVGDALVAERRFQERWRDYLDVLASDETSQAVVDRVLDLGLTTADLEKLVRSLAALPDLAATIVAAPPSAPAPAWPDLADLQRALAELASAAVPDDDKLKLALRPLADLLARLGTAGGAGPGLLADAAALLEKGYGSIGRAPSWGGAVAIQAARTVASAVAGELRQALLGLRSRALADLLPLLARFVVGEQAQRGREGLLTFDDLVVKLRDLMRDFPDAVVAMRERYDALLIDEFQDTDPLQMEIALAFAREPRSGRLEPGRLFLVGDPKQSVYRFRGADMAMYAAAHDRLSREGSGFPELALNRRCRKEIVDFVNAVFRPLIGDGDEPTLQPPYHPIHPEREPALAGPGVAWIGDAVDAPARRLREIEATAVVDHCVGAVRGGWQVVDRDGAVRAARFRDIAILLPTRNLLGPLERSLAAAGVPYRVEGGSLVYATQEVRDLISCLTAIDDPSDEVAVVAALRSPAFACSDRALLEYSAGGVRFDYLDRRLDEREGRIADALRCLRSYHRLRHDLSLAALTERFVGERGLVEVGVYDQGDRNSFRRARFVVEQARAFEASGPESLRAFVSWLEGRAGETILDHEGAGLDDDEDALRVMTVHGAKGLEFPIVFVAGLGVVPRVVTPVFARDRQRGDFSVSIGSGRRGNAFSLGDVTGAAEREREQQRAEQDRLLYVATTRARDHLVASLYHPQSSGRCNARRLVEVGGVREAARPLLHVAAGPPEPAGAFAGVAVDPADETLPFQEARAALVARATRERHVSATALGGAAVDGKDERRDETEPWAHGRGGTSLGRAVHAALQGLPLDADPAAIEAYARAQALAETLPERAGEVGRLVRAALATEAAGRARAARRALREVPYALARDDAVLEGFIDLVIESEDGIEIVDWKTDHVPPEAVPARLKDYELQAGLYVLGLEAATGRPVTRLTYVFVSAGRELSPGEPAALAAAARARVRSPGAV